MKPTVGRIVHYYSLDPGKHQSRGPHAAVIIDVETPERVTLWVFFPAPGSPREVANVPAEGSIREHYWAWPPREG